MDKLQFLVLIIIIRSVNVRVERSSVTFAASSKTFQNRPTMLSRFAYLQLNIRPSTNFEDNCICGFRFIFVYLFVSDN